MCARLTERGGAKEREKENEGGERKEEGEETIIKETIRAPTHHCFIFLAE